MSDILLQKYNVPGPRYTSYPTVPYWDNNFQTEQWVSGIRKSFQERNEGVSLYIHLPFCESMCTFCGCTKRITKNHNVEEPYIRALLKEWKLYCNLLNGRPLIKELHLGGGTPTFFSSKNLEDLINGIFAYGRMGEDCEMGFEGHPNNTTREHLQKLYELGFRRVSLGVQDYSERVQSAINRIQPYENVAKVTRQARDIGYTSIGHDLIYGLPHQDAFSVSDTIEKTIRLKPDRIAFYGYAHVPWIKGNGQRGFADSELPKDSEKRNLYETGRMLLESNGYHEIGMDHFALKEDALFKAAANGSLHRNFMGYCVTKTQLMLGLGISAIGDSWYGFAQNVKDFDDYYQMLEWDQLPIVKGHELNDEDLSVRTHILNLMCKFETFWTRDRFYFETVPGILRRLREMIDDGLVEEDDKGLRITLKGRPYVRNVCMAFDLRLQRNKPETQLFSTTV